MTELAERRAARDVAEIYLRELARIDRSQRRQRERAVSGERAHPLEFDESGFPIPQRNRALIERVAVRLERF